MHVYNIFHLYNQSIKRVDMTPAVICITLPPVYLFYSSIMFNNYLCIYLSVYLSTNLEVFSCMKFPMKYISYIMFSNRYFKTKVDTENSSFNFSPIFFHQLTLLLMKNINLYLIPIFDIFPLCIPNHIHVGTYMDMDTYLDKEFCIALMVWFHV